MITQNNFGTEFLVGVCGNAGSGKDTVASILSQFYSFRRHALADKVKSVVQEAFGISTHASNQPQLKNIPDQYWSEIFGYPFSPRKAAQLVGTEAFRSVFGNDIWINILERQIRSSLHKRVVVSDVRFKNEGQWILENGGTILHLTRSGADGKVGVLSHASEDLSWITELKGDKIYHIENNSTLHSLKSKLDSFVVTHFNLEIKPQKKETENV